MALDIPQQTLVSPNHEEIVSRVQEALAFDDVLVVPAYSQVLPSLTSTCDQADERYHFKRPADLRRDGHRHGS